MSFSMSPALTTGAELQPLDNMSAPADGTQIQPQTHGGGARTSIKRALSEDGAGETSAGTHSESKKRRNATASTGSTSIGTGAGTATGTTSSRGVANLTPDQLAKKRANDREAQRAIRLRTKNQIEKLQNTINELTSQQPYQELQNVLRQKELVEAENAEIKKRLASVLALIHPILGQTGLDVPAYPTPSQPYIPHRASSGSNMNPSTPSSTASPITGGTGPSQWQSPNLATNLPVAHEQSGYPPAQMSQPKYVNQQKHIMEANFDKQLERTGLDFLLENGRRLQADSSPVQKTPNSINSLPAPSSFHQIPRELEHISPAYHHHGVGQRSNSITSSSTSFSTPFSPSTNTTPNGHSLAPTNADASISAHCAPIRNGPATCPLDSLLLNFLRDRQTLLSEGAPASVVVGPAYPSVTSLLHPSRSAHSHPVSRVFTDILATFPDLSTLPEQVAMLYLMFLLMRWQISPTPENYDRLPDWYAPRPSQLFTPHPAWIDYLPWPRMRDRLVRDYSPREYLFDNFITPMTVSLSVNWPYEAMDTLVLSEPDRDEWVINPVFERHLRMLENWSLGPVFARRFPGLADTFYSGDGKEVER